MASGKLWTLVKLITRGKTLAEVHRALNVAQLTCLPWHPQNRRRTAAVLRHEGEEALQLTRLEKEGSKTKRRAPRPRGSAGGGAGGGGAFVAGVCPGVGRCRGKRLWSTAAGLLWPCRSAPGPQSERLAGWSSSPAVLSAIEAWSSRFRRPSCGVVSERSRLSPSAWTAPWLADCFARVFPSLAVPARCKELLRNPIKPAGGCNG
jgi:hypothetical protein